MSRARSESLHWFRVDVDLYDHPKTILLAAAGGWSTDKAVGRLVRMWSWVAKHSPTGHLDNARAVALDNHMIDHEQLAAEALGCGDTERGVDLDEHLKARFGVRLAAFAYAGFIEEDAESDGGVVVHNWLQMNGYAVREMERGRVRAEASRERRGKTANRSRTRRARTANYPSPARATQTRTGTREATPPQPLSAPETDPASAAFDATRAEPFEPPAWRSRR